jgi:hypothetical protein
VLDTGAVFDTEDNARTSVTPLTPANPGAVASAGVHAVEIEV